MDQTVFYVMTAFVIVSAIALCIQAGMLVAMGKQVKTLSDKVQPLLPKVEALVPKVESLVVATQTTVDQSRKQIVDITTQANQILASTRSQLAKVEEVVNDATARAKVQMDKVELVIDDTLNRAHETVATVHTGVMKPLRELNGIAAGVRGALAFLARGNRPSPDQATSDEEMFI
jgi:ABC-type transporter Mla subunit MlaD